ncbi:MAG: hypothetical protein AB7V56_11010 [Candidatus Nitrosocosmicus sp.]
MKITKSKDKINAFLPMRSAIQVKFAEIWRQTMDVASKPLQSQIVN